MSDAAATEGKDRPVDGGAKVGSPTSHHTHWPTPGKPGFLAPLPSDHDDSDLMAFRASSRPAGPGQSSAAGPRA